MALVFADRVLETSTTTGTGALTLAGAVTGFRAFSAVLTSPSDTCYYTIFEVDANGNPSGGWETGLGTYSGANTLTRTTVLASSNSNAAVNWAAGTRRVGIVPVGGGPPFSWINSTGDPAFPTGSVNLTNGTSNFLLFNANGIGSPTNTTRSAGTKVVFYPSLSVSDVDFAMGVSGGILWTSVGTTSNSFYWYGAGAVAAILSGTGNFTIAGTFTAPHIASPASPSADNISFTPQRLVASGGHVMARWKAEDGVYMTVHPHMGRNSVLRYSTNGGTGANNEYGATLTTVGTLTARAPATTNKLTRSLRSGVVSLTTAGQAAGIYISSANGARYTIGNGSGLGGFRAFFRWGASDAAAVSGAHMLIGMRSATAAPTVTTAPDTLTNVFGVAQVSGSTNLKIVQGGSAAQAAVDLGANFPAAGLSTDMYELILYCRPDNGNVSYRLERINTGDVAQGILTAATPGTQLPSNTTFLGPIMWRSNNATALAVGIDIHSMQMEADLV